MPPPEPATRLRDLQAAFGRSVRRARGDAADLRVLTRSDATGEFDVRLDVYRNNSWQFFLAALGHTYAVVQRRVGADYFRQLARDYREQHPSRRGDLHWVGAQFPAWLAVHLQDTGYDWLAELARLEWACEEALATPVASPVGLDELGRHDAEVHAQLTIALQPSLRLVDSRFPVWSVWQANQADVADQPIDLTQGPEHCAVACGVDRVVVYRLEAADFRLLARLQAGDALGAAVEASATDPDALGRLLAWAFGAGLVVAVSPSAPA